MTAVPDGGQIGQTCFTQEQIFEIGQILDKIHVSNVVVSKIQNLNVLAVFQIGQVPSDTQMVFGGHEIGGVGAQFFSADGDRPDEFDVLVALVQRVHLLVGDAAVDHIHLRQMGKIGQGVLQLLRIRQCYPGQVNERILGVDADTRYHEIPGKSDFGKGVDQQRDGLVAGELSGERNPANVGKIRKILKNFAHNGVAHHKHLGIVVIILAAQRDAVGDIQIRPLCHQRKQCVIVPAQSGVDPGQAGEVLQHGDVRFTQGIQRKNFQCVVQTAILKGDRPGDATAGQRGLNFLILGGCHARAAQIQLLQIGQFLDLFQLLHRVAGQIQRFGIPAVIDFIDAQIGRVVDLVAVVSPNGCGNGCNHKDCGDANPD